MLVLNSVERKNRLGAGSGKEQAHGEENKSTDHKSSLGVEMAVRWKIRQLREECSVDVDAVVIEPGRGFR